MPELEREGSPTDHRPVSATLSIRLLDELHPKGYDREKHPSIMTQFNRALSSAFIAYQTDRANQYTLHKKDVNQEHLDMAQNMIDSFASDIRETWDHDATVDDKVSFLDVAATNVYNEFCRKQSPVVVKQKYMTPELVSEACATQARWRIVKVLGHKAGIVGWEKEVRLFANNGGDIPFGTLTVGESNKLSQQVREWNKSRKELRIKINKAKSEHYSQLIEETKGGNSATIWNTINIIAPRKFNNKQAMQKVGGGWCMEPEEDLAEIQQFAQNELKQVPVDCFVTPPPPGPCDTSDFEQPTPMDVTAGFRRTNPNKAGTGWSVPNKLWVILENESSERFCEVWQQVGRERVFPKAWQRQKCAWIDKPGKRGRTIREKRGIMLSSAACKSYSNWTQQRTRRKMNNKWRNDCFGAISGRGTTQALLKVFSTRQQLKRAKKSTITFMGDGIKAFDRIDRRKVLDRIHSVIDDHDLAWRHEIRHDTVLVVSQSGDQEITMAMEDGVPQGDPNGPVLYVVGYSGVSGDIDDEREAKGYEGLLFENGIGPPGSMVDICRTTFVDDHKETHIIETESRTCEEVLDNIRQRVQEIMGNQAKWKVTNNMTKTVLLVELFGKGSRKLRKQIGNSIEIEPGVIIKIVRSNKYLGVQVGGGDESTGLEITQRIKNAGEAVTRLRKFWKIKGIDLQTKVKAYEQLVRTILVYGIETRVVSKAQMTRLECFQTRVLRRIGQSQSHITHESNEDVRLRLGVPSIESLMTKVRLRMWQKLASNPIPSVMAAVTGRIKGETHWGSGPHLRQLVDDLKQLGEMGGPQIECKISKQGKIKVDLSVNSQVATLTKKQTQCAVSHVSRLEKAQPKMGPQNELKFYCDSPGCTSSFSTPRQLQTHRVRSHGYRDQYRKLVIDEYCPMCKSKFASKVGAMNHIQKVCGTKGTEQERADKVNRILLERRIQSGEISSIGASFIRSTGILGTN